MPKATKITSRRLKVFSFTLTPNIVKWSESIEMGKRKGQTVRYMRESTDNILPMLLTGPPIPRD